MMSLILTLSMIPAATAAQPSTAQVQTCVWPHVCQTAPVAQVTTCVWPHVCTQEAPVLPILTSQVTTCVWPHVCKEQTKA
ncbi:MAG TPA: hypothetical protein VN915_15080 [Elusimicrobiota bacterium]|nr:hypothetical protein [Elusimicrobiota bacterium]